MTALMADAQADKVPTMKIVWRVTWLCMLASGLGFSPARSQDAGDAIQFNMKAVEELADTSAAAQVAAALAPAPDPLADASLYDPITVQPPAPANPSQGLQLIYGRGDIIIAPSARETLQSWLETFVSPNSRLEVLSYSGSANPTWEVPGNDPGNLATLARHEAIRTAFKRAIVVRDILTEHGIPGDNIVVRALGHATDGGPVERIDIVLNPPQ